MVKTKSSIIRPSYYDDDESDFEGDELSRTLKSKGESESDDEISSISFGALNSAQKKLAKQKATRKTSPRNSRREYENEEESGSEEDRQEGRFFEESDSDAPPQESSSKQNNKKKSKHAPSESSAKRHVSRIRDIPGLDTKKSSGLYTDIRFDPAYGKADLAQSRKNYAFLDEYRQQEIKEMESVLKDKKSAHLLREAEREELKLKIQSLKSRLDTMKNRDLERKIVSEHKRQQIKNVKEGEQTNPYFLKKSEQRKLIQKAKFDSMKSSQREKVMERKRKRRLGKEFRQLEFNQRP